jgi:hypothetical protein
LWVQVGKDAVIIEADAIKNRDAMYKHLSSWDLTRDDPTLSSYVHEYSTKAAETLLAAAGEAMFFHSACDFERSDAQNQESDA